MSPKDVLKNRTKTPLGELASSEIKSKIISVSSKQHEPHLKQNYTARNTSHHDYSPAKATTMDCYGAQVPKLLNKGNSNIKQRHDTQGASRKQSDMSSEEGRSTFEILTK